MGILGSDVNNSFADKYSANGKDMTDEQSFSHTFFLQASNNNQYFSTIAELKLKQPNSLLSNANWGPTTGSPLLGSASFTDSYLSSGFDKVTYVGAFASENDNWMAGWTNFDPQNTEY